MLRFSSPPNTNATLEDIVESKSEENITVAVNPKKTTIIENPTASSPQSQQVETSDDKEATVQPDFLNEKEKQCWDMYCKMSEKGISVTFDTILRGMLTPTEYRMRKKPEPLQTEENVQNDDETNKTSTEIK